MPKRSLLVDDLILNLYNYFTAEKNNGGPLISVLKVHERICGALGVSETKLKTVLKKQESDDSRTNEAGVSDRSSIKGGTENRVKYKRREHIKTTDLHNNVKLEIKNVIYDMRAAKQHITLDTLLSELRRKQLVEIGRTSLWQLLKHMGFKYKMQNNRKFLCEQSSVVHKRIQFLRNYSQLKKSGYQFVYLDETWIFSKGGNKRIWQDDDIKSATNCNSQGKRYIVLHAGNTDGFIENADLIFSTKAKTADYHDNMNTEMFTKWLKEKLLINLREPSVIVLDNAPYHSEFLNKTPNNSWNKTSITEWLNANNIIYPEHSLKIELLMLVKRHQRPKEYIVDNIIHEHGHLVLRLPPYHCQFNPIENIWGICKRYYDNHIGRNGHSEEAVLEMWQEALCQVTPEMWQKSVEHADKIIDDYWAKEQHIDVIAPIIITFDTECESSEIDE